MGRAKAADVLVQFIFTNILLVLTISGVLLGLILGFVLRPMELSPIAEQLIRFPGELFMQALKMIILPLIFASVISALCQMGARSGSRMGGFALVYYLTTATLASLEGMALVLLIRPGDALGAEMPVKALANGQVDSLDTFLDLFRNMFPENIFKATTARYQTRYVRDNLTAEVIEKEVVYADGTNILGILVFCTVFGLITSSLRNSVECIVDFFIALDAVVMRMVELLMWMAPIGIVSLIAGNLLEVHDLGSTITTLLLYVATVLAALATHALIVTPCLYLALTMRNPIKIYRGMLDPFFVAFGTASSGAALPMSMHCLTNKVGIDRRIANFIPPLGATLNMDGPALYEAIAAVFIAQINNIPLSFGNYFTICLTATFASIGSSSVPAGLVTIVIILNTVGLPIDAVSLLFTVDWFLDRLRTAINVMGDGFAASVVAHYVRVEDEDDNDDEKDADLSQV